MIIQNKGDLVRNGAGLRLVPGTNEVDNVSWKGFISHPLNKHLVDTGELVPQETVDGAPKALGDLNGPEAVALVKDTYDMRLLASFLDEEEKGKKRSTVIDAIKKQAEETEKSIAEAKKKAEEENE